MKLLTDTFKGNHEKSEKLNKEITYSLLNFNVSLAFADVIHFRKVFTRAYGERSDLFHNHQSHDAVIYRYPLLQYKIYNNRLAILALAEAVGFLDEILEKGIDSLEMGQIKGDLSLHSFKKGVFDFKGSNAVNQYRLSDWLALNTKNYKLFQESIFMEERVAILNKVLMGNILSAAKGLDWHIGKEIWVDIQAIEKACWLKHKAHKMQAFDIVFATNLKLPAAIGLGKSSSVGFGTLSEIL